MDTNETTIYYAVLITGIVLGIILFYFAITIYRSHNKHFRLLRKHVLAEIELLEQERTRIAHDLHDDLGPLLLIAQKHIQTTNGKAIEDSEHLAKAIKKIEELHERFAGIAQNLTPKVLVTKGLQTALEDFIESLILYSPEEFKSWLTWFYSRYLDFMKTEYLYKEYISQ